MAKLNEIFKLQMGKTPARNNSNYWTDGKYNWISIADLGTYQKYTENTKEKISECAVHDSGIKVVPANTVIMSFKLSLGKTAITKEPVYTNEAIMAFVPTGKYDVFPDYFYYLFAGKNWSEETNRAVMGSTLNKATLSEISVVVPPIDEQRKIAAVLDKVSNLITKRRQQLDKLDLLIKARFVEMFGDLIINKQEWKFSPLSKLCDVRDGTHDSPEYIDSGYPLLTSKNFTSGVIDFLNCNLISKEDFDRINQRSKVDVGDIVMPMIGTIGNPIIVNTERPFAIKNVALIKFNGSNVSNIFVKEILDSEYFKHIISSTNRGGTQKFVALGDIRKLPIPIVPLGLQNQFATFVEQTEKTKISISRSLEKLETLKKALMQEYFGGESIYVYQ